MIEEGRGIIEIGREVITQIETEEMREEEVLETIDTEMIEGVPEEVQEMTEGSLETKEEGAPENLTKVTEASMIAGDQPVSKNDFRFLLMIEL